MPRLKHGLWVALLAIMLAGVAAAIWAMGGPLPPRQAVVAPAKGGLLDRIRARSDFFPLGVWQQSPSLLDEYRALGVNVFVGFNGKPTVADLSRFAQAGVYVVDRRGSDFPYAAARGVLLAWLAKDEPDNAQRGPDGRFGSCIAPDALMTTANAARAADGVPIFQNFGRGVAITDWNGRGDCTGNAEHYYPAAADAGDIVAFDVYPVATDGGRLERVAEGTRNLRRWAGSNKPIWAFIEAAPILGGPVPTPAQLRAMAWMAIVNGSRGIVLFPWKLASDGGRARQDALFAYPALVEAVRGLSAELREFAPVLNAGAEIPGTSVRASTGRVSMIARRYGGIGYIFAVSESPSPLHAAFAVPGRGVAPAVLGENRNVARSNGRFDDDFQPYAVHIYRLDG